MPRAFVTSYNRDLQIDGFAVSFPLWPARGWHNRDHLGLTALFRCSGAAPQVISTRGAPCHERESNQKRTLFRKRKRQKGVLLATLLSSGYATPPTSRRAGGVLARVDDCIDERNYKNDERKAKMQVRTNKGVTTTTTSRSMLAKAPSGPPSPCHHRSRPRISDHHRRRWRGGRRGRQGGGGTGNRRDSRRRRRRHCLRRWMLPDCR